ncbi:phosphomannomutase CpsG [Kosakonia cowanii]|jgi:phosphomannomutase|uniref:phosphomannomutase CpsG n=1 Tax=Kosakonia cowanii TaxID=208223 RepID=UPI001F58404A|nr:phosphomannomutase CpsG [Kosakonia cowanii]MDT3412775.1 phosphomannomutase [Atlantibacter sp. SORGH_AS_0304]
MTQLSCFKTYDIRGRIDSEITTEIAWKIGKAFGLHTKARSVVVGGDCRLTSESFKMALANGLRDAGVDVIDIGMVGTEEIYFATSYLKLDGGIEVTASHNPIDYNGMKIVGRDSKPISCESGLNEIKLLAETLEIDESKTEFQGQYKKISLKQEYIDHILSFIDLSNLRPLKLVINSGNGSAGLVIDCLEKRFQEKSIPITIIKVHNDPDGTFPHGIPNPLLPECRQDTRDAVVEHGADLGIAFDGDFDRCFFFDSNGRFIEGYYIVGLLAASFLKKEPGAKIIHDPRLLFNTIDIVKKAGGTPVLSKTGHAFIKDRMRAENAIYGGEMSAHHYFRDFFYCDSGMIPWLLVIEMLSIEKTGLSQLIDASIAAWPASGEINRNIEDAQLCIKDLCDHYAASAQHVDYTDGVSMEFAQWRFNVRISNTESLVRLNVESRGDQTLMQQKTAELLNFLERYVA